MAHRRDEGGAFDVCRSRIIPEPVLPRLKAPDDVVTCAESMRRCVPSEGVVAAADVPTCSAAPQVHPPEPFLLALHASCAAGSACRINVDGGFICIGHADQVSIVEAGGSRSRRPRGEGSYAGDDAMERALTAEAGAGWSKAIAATGRCDRAKRLAVVASMVILHFWVRPRRNIPPRNAAGASWGAGAGAALPWGPTGTWL